MAVIVSYKGNTIIDTNDTIIKTLLTSGKYCEDNITISNTHGVIPTGSISISENGTYDVTDKASAIVNIQSEGQPIIALSNCRVVVEERAVK